MTIRTATVADLPAIVEIYNQAVAARQTGDTEPVRVDERREWLRRHPPERRPILVADDGDSVVGWASLSDHRPGRRALSVTAEISYYVHESHRRRGVATALIRDACRRCPALGVTTLFAILLEDNDASVALLERLGFERWGHLPRVADFGDREVGQLYYGLRVSAARPESA